MNIFCIVKSGCYMWGGHHNVLSSFVRTPKLPIIYVWIENHYSLKNVLKLLFLVGWVCKGNGRITRIICVRAFWFYYSSIRIERKFMNLIYSFCSLMLLSKYIMCYHHRHSFSRISHYFTVMSKHCHFIPFILYFDWHAI